MIAKIKKFFSEVTAELKKVSWTSRQELIDATRLVIISSVCLGFFIGATDFVLSRLLAILIR
jgi:preprotein translocase subunit SecE